MRDIEGPFRAIYIYMHVYIYIYMVAYIYRGVFRDVWSVGFSVEVLSKEVKEVRGGYGDFGT